MVRYVKAKAAEFQITGYTHENTRGWPSVESAKGYGLFDENTDGWLLDVKVENVEGLRHRGLGRSLVEEFEEECRKLGLARVVCLISYQDDDYEFIDEKEFQIKQTILEEWYQSMGYSLEKRPLETGDILTFGIKII